MVEPARAHAGPARPQRDYRSVLERLRRARARGVELRILHASLPSRPFRDEFDRHPRLVRGGLELRLCPRVHLKTVIVDGALAVPRQRELDRRGPRRQGRGPAQLRARHRQRRRAAARPGAGALQSIWTRRAVRALPAARHLRGAAVRRGSGGTSPRAKQAARERDHAARAACEAASVQQRTVPAASAPPLPARLGAMARSLLSATAQRLALSLDRAFASAALVPRGNRRTRSRAAARTRSSSSRASTTAPSTSPRTARSSPRPLRSSRRSAGCAASAATARCSSCAGRARSMPLWSDAKRCRCLPETPRARAAERDGHAQRARRCRSTAAAACARSTSRSANNRTAVARWFRHRSGVRPCAVLLHGYMGGVFAIEERMFPVRKLFAGGMDVVLSACRSTARAATRAAACARRRSRRATRASRSRASASWCSTIARCSTTSSGAARACSA